MDEVFTMVIPVFLPHAGCTVRCIYCHQGYITGIGEKGVQERIDRALRGRAEPCEVGLFGGNMFGVEPADLERLFSCFAPYRGIIQGFRLSTKPVPLRDETIDILKRNGVRFIELGIPTFNDVILAALNRAHTAGDLFQAFDRLQGEGFRLALQFMVGLPGETMGDIEETAENMVRLRPEYIRIYPLVILRNTPLYRLYETGEFAPIAFDEALERAALIYRGAREEGIDVVNVGLTDNEMVRGMVAGGFYHPAFGSLVQSRIFRDALGSAIGQLKGSGEARVILHRNDIPLLVGYRRENLKYFASLGIDLSWDPSGAERGSFDVIRGRERARGKMIDRKE
ncbi:MAG: Oxygen-independent coproporphyrinogen-III oxidase 1 [Syntrophorhabdus sp. PtaB.Bin184]|jgi:histone acetyltransferase (RNA polymerase elongator complex component)|nr:MAG: Oxygen-independent coproporphyrinogen-III oxidase 1 [Syntrophorhabdus sp. PtaB.Bin184]